MKEVFEKIIKRFKQLQGCDSLANMFISDVIKVIKSIEKEYNNGWIPCSERLPETSGFYLISTVTGVVGSVSYCIEQESRVMHTSLGTAIAWQPLPEPYRTKGEEHA